MKHNYLIKRTLCNSCNKIIDEFGMCNYGCQYDDLHLSERPKGSILERVYEVSEVLISEEIK